MHDCIHHLIQAGITRHDATALRRIAMTLHRWHELECGDSNDYASWCIVRGRKVRPHWHKVNPWRDSVVYVPIEDLADCAAGGTVNVQGIIQPYTAEWLLTHWRQYGSKLDAYILPQPNGSHAIGIRYGAEEKYLSPYNANPDKIRDLLARYRNGAFEYADDGAAFIERHLHCENRARYEAIPDRERGARKRLARIMAGYPGFQAYVQGDPRGAALYILRPGDLPAGASIDSCYSRGIAVYK